MVEEAALLGRKVYAFYGYRAPLRDLLGMSWSNPFLVVIITWMKLTKSKQLIRDFFHWSEARALSEENWDPELQKIWEECQAMDESSGWTLLGSEWLGSSVGDNLTQGFTMISLDGCHAMSGSLVRLSTAHASGVVLPVYFRSWRSDGTLRLTSNRRFQRPLPDEWKERLSEEAKLRHRTLEASGIHGPVREIEIPG